MLGSLVEMIDEKQEIDSFTTFFYNLAVIQLSMTLCGAILYVAIKVSFRIFCEFRKKGQKFQIILAL